MTSRGGVRVRRAGAGAYNAALAVAQRRRVAEFGVRWPNSPIVKGSRPRSVPENCRVNGAGRPTRSAQFSS